MPGDASNIPVLLTGDVYIFDPTVTFVSGTHMPTDIDADLHAAWLALGLMKGDPGVEQPRSIDKTDVMSWQQGRVKTIHKNGKQDANFTLLERNPNVLKLINPTDTPRQVLTRLAFVYVRDDGTLERDITLKPADVWVPNDNRQEEVNGTSVECSLYPANGVIYLHQEGIPT